MVLGLFFVMIGIGVFCASIFNFAVYALPAAAGLWAGFAALHSGSGPLLAFAIGFVAGAIVFGIGQSVWNSRQPRFLRYGVTLLFVVPAVWTGYCATQQISVFFVPAASWQFASAVVGAVAVGLTAFVRLTSGRSVPNEMAISDSYL